MGTNNRGWMTLAFALALALLGLWGSALAQDAGNQDHDAKARDHHPGKPYGLIFGTAYTPDDRPVYGARIQIHPVGKKHPSWDLVSDHHGEFAQRVPKGPGDYLVTGEVEVAPIVNGKPQMSKKKRLTGERTVHIEDQEERDFSLHLEEAIPTKNLAGAR